MAIIGTFKREGTGFVGSIRTFTFHLAYVTIEPVAAKKSGKSPDFRVYDRAAGFDNIGAAWDHSRDGKERLGVQIDDATFPSPIDCRLIKNSADDNYSLIWERDR